LADTVPSVPFVGESSASRNCICPVSSGVANNWVERIFVVSPGRNVNVPEIGA
jgi:hypothetical protein